MLKHQSLIITDVQLRVSDLDRALRFYHDLLGFAVRNGEPGRVHLSAVPDGPTLIQLVHDPAAPPRPLRSPGLYHMALNVPHRQDLASWLAQLLENHYPVQGGADHLVSEALYLIDPEGNGVELTVDRSESEWPYHDGALLMGTDPLDLRGLLHEAPPGDFELPAGTRVGHLHLQVGSTQEAETFFHDQLGLDVVTRDYPGALFLSAGGYHHHIGANTWNSGGTAAPPKNALGLQGYTLTRPSAPADAPLTHLTDPTGATVTLR